MTKVKICANKSIEDAKACLDAGADIIGILVGQQHESNDFVTPDKAKEICDYVAGRCDVSLVTHLTDASEIINLTKYIGNNVIQLHSSIHESEVKKIVDELPDVELVRVIHVSKDGSLYTDISSIIYANYFLLDSYNLTTDQVGGTGITHDWTKSKDIVSNLDRPSFVAGGLTPENVSTAIEIIKPYGVDVNSGCKNDAGVKDPEKVKAFVENVRNYDKSNELIDSIIEVEEI